MAQQSEIAAAQATFTTVVASWAVERIPVTIGFPSGNTDADVFWIPSLDMWAFFGEPRLEKSPGARYWNVFGMGRPSGMVSIVCEINSPKHGINRADAGVFMHSDTGRVALAHRGIFTAKGRVPLKLTRARFNWKWTTVTDGDRDSSVMSLGEVEAPTFRESLRAFVREVDQFKPLVRFRATE